MRPERRSWRRDHLNNDPCTVLLLIVGMLVIAASTGENERVSRTGTGVEQGWSSARAKFRESQTRREFNEWTGLARARATLAAINNPGKSERKGENTKTTFPPDFP